MVAVLADVLRAGERGCNLALEVSERAFVTFLCFLDGVFRRSEQILFAARHGLFPCLVDGLAERERLCGFAEVEGGRVFFRAALMVEDVCEAIEERADFLAAAVEVIEGLHYLDDFLGVAARERRFVFVRVGFDVGLGLAFFDSVVLLDGPRDGVRERVAVGVAFLHLEIEARDVCRGGLEAVRDILDGVVHRLGHFRDEVGVAVGAREDCPLDAAVAVLVDAAVRVGVGVDFVFAYEFSQELCDETVVASFREVAVALGVVAVEVAGGDALRVGLGLLGRAHARAARLAVDDVLRRCLVSVVRELAHENGLARALCLDGSAHLVFRETEILCVLDEILRVTLARLVAERIGARDGHGAPVAVQHDAVAANEWSALIEVAARFEVGGMEVGRHAVRLRLHLLAPTALARLKLLRVCIVFRDGVAVVDVRRREGGRGHDAVAGMELFAAVRRDGHGFARLSFHGLSRGSALFAGRLLHLLAACVLGRFYFARCGCVLGRVPPTPIGHSFFRL